MKLKLTNKRRAIQIGAFGVILVFVLGLVLNSNFRQAKADMVDVSVDNTIKILEVGPGNLSRLANGIGTNTGSANGKNYTVTYMSMPEYISGIDDIAGKYDIVAITNKDDNLADNFTDGNVLDTKYTKYSTEFSSKMSNLKYSKNNDDQNDNGYASSGTTLTNKYSGKDNTYVEFYSENDITDKRANEILDMAKRGQVVYVENSALIASSKLEANFKNEEKVIKVDTVDINTVLNAYDSSSKRPKIKNFKVNADDTNLDYGNKDTRKLDFKFDYDNAPDNFIVKVYVDYNADGMFKEYASDSGYRSELLCTETLSKSSGSYEVKCNKLYSSFVGYLDWKVEIYSGTDVKNCTKSDVISSFRFKKLTSDKSGAIKLKVLQVYPDVINMFNSDGTFNSRGNYKDVGGLVLSGDGNTNSQKFKEFLNAVKDYDVTVESMSVTQFNNNCISNTAGMQSYDMIIIGFGDSYGADYDFNNNAMNVIQNYINNKAIMLSHDTMTLAINRSVTSNNDGSGAKGNTRFTNMLKDVVGQSRYDSISYASGGSYVVNSDGSMTFKVKCTDGGDVYLAGTMFGSGDWKATKQKMTSLGDNMYEYTIPASDLTKGTTYEYQIVSKDNNFWNDPNNTKVVNGHSSFVYGEKETAKSLGQTLYAIRDNSHGVTRDGANFYEQSKTTTVREVGQAQITEYPYNLSDTGISTGSNVDGQNAINISQTHTQWYQLDLENDDISPWFNLVADGSYFGAKGDQFNSGDARNFYYTYSIGNITYSGTGHTSNYTDAELKLFVNTIIRAARSAKISELNLEASVLDDISTDSSNPTTITNINEIYPINFEVKGTVTETISNNQGTTSTTKDYTGEVVNEYTLVVYDKDGNVVDMDTSTIGSGDTSGFTPVYTIASSTVRMLGEKEYKLAITLNPRIPDNSSYDSANSTGVTVYVTAEMPEAIAIKHGMAKDVEDLETWYNKSEYVKDEIDSGNPTVEYYTSVPFEAYVSGLKTKTEKIIKLTLDKKFLVSDDFKPTIYSVLDGKLSKIELANEAITKKVDNNENIEFTIDLGKVSSKEIVIKYDVKTMTQPEQTTEVGDDGINISVGENVVYENVIKVISETENSEKANVSVGREVFDRPLF